VGKNLLQPPWAWIGVAVMAVYTLMAGSRVYGGRWWARVLRSVALTLRYTALLALTVPLVWLLARVV
jgi:hypothetical protein